MFMVASLISSPLLVNNVPYIINSSSIAASSASTLNIVSSNIVVFPVASVALYSSFPGYVIVMVTSPVFSPAGMDAVNLPSSSVVAVVFAITVSSGSVMTMVTSAFGIATGSSSSLVYSSIPSTSIFSTLVSLGSNEMNVSFGSAGVISASSVAVASE